MVRIPTHRQPTHPGEMLLEEFLNPMQLTQRDLADAIHVPYQRINDIVNGRRTGWRDFDVQVLRSQGVAGFLADVRCGAVAGDIWTDSENPR